VRRSGIVENVPRVRSFALAPIALLVASTAFAQEPSPPPPPAPAPAEATPADSLTPGQVHLESDTTPPPATTIPAAPLEAPPPLPRHKGVVVEGNLGALGFLGNFRHVAPTAPWFHVLAGYEIFNWLLLFAEGELAFTDTSEAEGPSQVYGFPIFGFGGGARVTIHPTARFAFYLQGDIDALEANVPKGALADLGYKNAESLGIAFGGRLGFEWYQMDRHMALGITGGARDATGFAKTIGSDTGLMADASLLIRYTF
jgi:hypothetical protein